MGIGRLLAGHFAADGARLSAGHHQEAPGAPAGDRLGRGPGGNAKAFELRGRQVRRGGIRRNDSHGVKREEARRAGHHRVPEPDRNGHVRRRKGAASGRDFAPEKIAEIVYDSFKKNKPYVLEPFSVKITPLIKSLLPNSAFNILFKAIGLDDSMDTFKWH